MTDGALRGLGDLLGTYGERWQISPACNGDGGITLTAVPRPPDEDFTPITASTVAEMRRKLDAHEARLAPDLTGPLSRTIAPDEADRVRGDIARHLMVSFPGWEVECDPAGWVARRGQRLIRASSAAGLGAKLAAESGQYSRPRLQEPPQ